MTSTVQVVIQDCGQILNVPADQLRSDLKSAPTEELKLFLKTIGNEDWLKTLSGEQQTSLCVKVFSVLPPAASIDLIGPFMKTLQKFNLPPSSEKFVKKSFRENREFFLAGAREVYCKEHNVEEVSDQTLFLYMILGGLHRRGDGDLLDELMQQEVSLTEKVNGKDLLEMGYTLGTADQFKRILAYYQSKMENSAFRELFVERGEKIAGKIAVRLELLGVFFETCKSLDIDPASFLIKQNWIRAISGSNNYEALGQISPFLPVEERKKLYETFGFSLILSSAKRNQQEALNHCLQTLRELAIDPACFLPKRYKNHPTYLENFFMMLGEREACKAIVAATGNTSGKKVVISKTDQLYQTFEQEKAREKLEEMWKGIITALEDKDKSIWQDEKFIAKVHTFMEAAFLEMVFMFRDAWEKSDHQSEKMSDSLSDQQLEQSYVGYFFHGGFVEMYHLARGLAINKGEYLSFRKLTPEDEAPFFNHKKEQFHWRQMYMSYLSLFDHYSVSSNFKRYFFRTATDLIPRLKLKEGERRFDFTDLYWQNRIGFDVGVPVVSGQSPSLGHVFVLQPDE